MKKVVQVFTVSTSIIFIEGLAKELKKNGYQLYVISANGPEGQNGESSGDFKFLPVEMARGLSIIKNLKSCFRIRKILKEIKPDIVHGNTPIGGLVAMTVAKSLGIKNRVFTMHGLKYPGEIGLKRWIIKEMEKFTVHISSITIVVSNALKEFAIQEKITDPEKLVVINHGSVKGIDIEKSCKIRENGRYFYEKKFGLKDNVFRIGYFGRINEEKGVLELIEACVEIFKKNSKIEIILCGEEEMAYEGNRERLYAFIQHKNVHFLGFVPDPLEHMICCDCIVLPTYREGFGLVNIEANSVGVPVITTDIMGCKDSIEDGVTGFFIPVGNINELVNKIEYFFNNKEIAIAMGKSGIERVEKLFNRKDIWQKLIYNYNLWVRQGKDNDCGICS